MVDIGIEVAVLRETKQLGRSPVIGPFRLTCAALGLETEAEYLNTGLCEIRRLRVEELERRLAERPGDWELRTLLREAQEDEGVDSEAAVEMILTTPFECQDEIEAEPEPVLTLQDRNARNREWRAARKRTFEAARKKRRLEPQR